MSETKDEVAMDNIHGFATDSTKKRAHTQHAQSWPIGPAIAHALFLAQNLTYVFSASAADAVSLFNWAPPPFTVALTGSLGRTSSQNCANAHVCAPSTHTHAVAGYFRTGVGS